MTVKSGTGDPENASSGNTASPRFTAHPPIGLTTLIFSRDRTLQLDATLRTLRRHCRDLSLSTQKILYRASDARHAAQYRELKSCYREYTFIAENNFRADLLRLRKDRTGYLLLLDANDIFFPVHILLCLYHLTRSFSSRQNLAVAQAWSRQLRPTTPNRDRSPFHAHD